MSDRWQEISGHGNDLGYKFLEVELTKGLHQLDLLVYGATQRFRGVVHMRWPGKKEFRAMGVNWNHGGFCAWEPIATAHAGNAERRGQKPSISFSYKVIARTSGKVDVHARWEYVISGAGHGRDAQWDTLGNDPSLCLSARESEFRESMPIQELVSAYHRAGGGEDKGGRTA